MIAHMVRVQQNILIIETSFIVIVHVQQNWGCTAIVLCLYSVLNKYINKIKKTDFDLLILM